VGSGGTLLMAGTFSPHEVTWACSAGALEPHASALLLAQPRGNAPRDSGFHSCALPPSFNLREAGQLPDCLRHTRNPNADRVRSNRRFIALPQSL